MPAQVVISFAANQRVGVLTTVDILNTDQRVCAYAGTSRCAQCQVDCNRPCGIVVLNGVRVSATVQGVVASTTDKIVGASATRDAVIAVVAEELVVAVSAVDYIIVQTTVKGVIASQSNDGVIARASV